MSYFDQFRYNLNTSFSDSPYFLKTLLQIKVVNHMFLEELLGNVFPEDLKLSNNLFFYPNARVVIKFGIIVKKEPLVLIMGQIRRHPNNQLYTHNLTFLIIIMTHLNSYLDYLSFLFTTKPVFYLWNDRTGLLFYLS